eukprot:SAG11_NODE_13_length_26388_cov_67.360341_6_plen_117_part_00
MLGALNTLLANHDLNITQTVNKSTVFQPVYLELLRLACLHAATLAPMIDTGVLGRCAGRGDIAYTVLDLESVPGDIGAVQDAILGIEAVVSSRWLYGAPVRRPRMLNSLPACAVPT